MSETEQNQQPGMGVEHLLRLIEVAARNASELRARFAYMAVQVERAPRVTAPGAVHGDLRAGGPVSAQVSQESPHALGMRALEKIAQQGMLEINNLAVLTSQLMASVRAEMGEADPPAPEKPKGPRLVVG